MPDIDLDAIEARLAAATPGPWGRGDRWNVQGASHCTCAPRYGPLIHEGRMDINGTMMQAHVHQAESPWHPYGIYGAPSARSRWHPAAVVIETDEYGLMDDTDADLIAHAPEDLAALVAEVRALRAVAESAMNYRRAHNLDSPSCDECRTLNFALDAWRDGEGNE